MSKHTPGPWELKRDPMHYDTLTSIEGGGKNSRFGLPRELMVEIGGYAGNQTAESNARLIAAAPEMLQILQELEFVLEDKNGDAVLCPICCERLTHADDCKLGNILKKVEND